MAQQPATYECPFCPADSPKSYVQFKRLMTHMGKKHPGGDPSLFKAAEAVLGSSRAPRVPSSPRRDKKRREKRGKRRRKDLTDGKGTTEDNPVDLRSVSPPHQPVTGPSTLRSNPTWKTAPNTPTPQQQNVVASAKSQALSTTPPQLLGANGSVPILGQTPRPSQHTRASHSQSTFSHNPGALSLPSSPSRNPIHILPTVTEVPDSDNAMSSEAIVSVKMESPYIQQTDSSDSDNDGDNDCDMQDEPFLPVHSAHHYRARCEDEDEDEDDDEGIGFPQAATLTPMDVDPTMILPSRLPPSASLGPLTSSDKGKGVKRGPPTDPEPSDPDSDSDDDADSGSHLDRNQKSKLMRDSFFPLEIPTASGSTWVGMKHTIADRKSPSNRTPKQTDKPMGSGKDANSGGSKSSPLTPNTLRSPRQSMPDTPTPASKTRPVATFPAPLAAPVKVVETPAKAPSQVPGQNARPPPAQPPASPKRKAPSRTLIEIHDDLDTPPKAARLQQLQSQTKSIASNTAQPHTKRTLQTPRTPASSQNQPQTTQPTAVPKSQPPSLNPTAKTKTPVTGYIPQQPSQQPAQAPAPKAASTATTFPAFMAQAQRAARRNSTATPKPASDAAPNHNANANANAYANANARQPSRAGGILSAAILSSSAPPSPALAPARTPATAATAPATAKSNDKNRPAPTARLGQCASTASASGASIASTGSSALPSPPLVPTSAAPRPTPLACSSASGGTLTAKDTTHPQLLNQAQAQRSQTKDGCSKNGPSSGNREERRSDVHGACAVRDCEVCRLFGHVLLHIFHWAHSMPMFQCEEKQKH